MDENPLLAVSYRVLPELRRMVEAWEVRAYLAGTGVLVAYILLRLRGRSARFGSPLAFTRLAIGASMSTAIWLAVDLYRNESFLAELWTSMPPEYVDQVKALVLVGVGWVAWAIAFAELLRWAMIVRQPGSAGRPV